MVYFLFKLKFKIEISCFLIKRTKKNIYLLLLLVLFSYFTMNYIIYNTGGTMNKMISKKVTCCNRYKFLLLVLIYLSFSVSSLFSQWSSISNENNNISDLNGDQVIPKIATLSNGNYYISWFSNEGGNYDTRLQLLDPQGNELWEHNGILISDNATSTWVTDYDLSVDNTDCAIITFQDYRDAGNTNIYAYRISATGEFLWGDNGVALSSNTNFEGAPKCTVTDTGSTIFAWQSEYDVRLQKISSGGDVLWGDEGILLHSDTENYTWPHIIPAGDDNTFLVWAKETGVPYAPYKDNFVQKLDPDGNFLFAEDVALSTTQGVLAYAQPSLERDANNGIVVQWTDGRGNSNPATYIQHVGNDGSVLMQDNGVAVSSNYADLQVNSEITFDPINDEVYIFWMERNGNQNMSGIFGQKLSVTGEKLWGDNGISFVAMSSDEFIPIGISYSDNGVIVSYHQSTSPVNSNILAMKIDPSGNYIWGENGSVIMSSAESSKGHKVFSEFANDQCIALWEDDRSGNVDIYAQNISIDGELGPVVGINDNYQLSIVNYQLKQNYPNPFNPVTKINYELGITNYELAEIVVYNATGQQVWSSPITVHSSQLTGFILFNGSSFNSGIYYYSLVVDGKKMSTKAMVLIK